MDAHVPPQPQPQQQPQLFDESCYRRLRQALLDVGVRPELAAKFTDDDLGLLLREGFQDAEDVQTADAAALQRAGLRASCVSYIAKAQQHAAAAQHNGVAVPGCGVADQEHATAQNRVAGGRSTAVGPPGVIAGQESADNYAAADQVWKRAALYSLAVAFLLVPLLVLLLDGTSVGHSVALAATVLSFTLSANRMALDLGLDFWTAPARRQLAHCSTALITFKVLATVLVGPILIVWVVSWLRGALFAIWAAAL